MKKLKSALFGCLVLFTFLPAVEAVAQISLGVDIANRYVWRGTDFGDSPSIQPELSYTTGGFEIGVWGALATTGNPAGTEISPYISYTFETDAGDFSLILTDYTFPGVGGAWALDGDTHALEIGLAYDGLLSVFAGVFIYGDDDNSAYIELGYELNDIGIFLGFSPTASDEYGTDGFGIINTGISYEKELKITDSFSLGLNSALILNPTAESLFLVFGISF